MYECILPLVLSLLKQRNTPAKAAMSGAFAGGVSVLLFQGIDVIKSRMQVSGIGLRTNLFVKIT
jgi:hypothetical protein